MSALPTVKIENVEIPKAIIGINSLLGWSHTSSGRDEWIRKHYTTSRVAKVFAKCMELGMNAVLGPIYQKLNDAIRKAQDMTGSRLTFLPTCSGGEDIPDQLKAISDLYVPICLVHGGPTDKWPVKDGRLENFEHRLSLIRDAGIIPGAVCHNGERLKLLNEVEYGAAVFAIPVNKAGFLMNPSKEIVLSAVNSSKKPVIAIKPLGSGRFDEGRIKEWLQWTFAVKGVCAIVIGFMSAEEATEDITILKEILL